MVTSSSLSTGCVSPDKCKGNHKNHMEMETNSIKHEDNVAIIDNHTALNLVTPKRVIHFSDGVIEEFSDDDEQDEDEPDSAKNDTKDPSAFKHDEIPLEWRPWLIHQVKKTGSTLLAGCDSVGEFLASAFGITTPKYNLEIEEFKRYQEENRRIEMENENAATWQGKNENSLNNNEVITSDNIAMSAMKKY